MSWTPQWRKIHDTFAPPNHPHLPSEKGVNAKRKEFALIRLDPFSERARCAGKQTVNLRSCLSCLKHYENTLFKYIENFTSKNREFSDKNWYFHTSAQNIDVGYSLEPPQRGSSNEYPQSMFLIRNKKNNVYPCKPQFYYMWGLRGSKLYRHVFVMIADNLPSVSGPVNYI